MQERDSLLRRPIAFDFRFVEWFTGRPVADVARTHSRIESMIKYDAPIIGPGRPIDRLLFSGNLFIVLSPLVKRTSLLYSLPLRFSSCVYRSSSFCTSSLRLLSSCASWRYSLRRFHCFIGFSKSPPFTSFFRFFTIERKLRDFYFKCASRVFFDNNFTKR